jgi:hypothetical protein
MAINFVPRDYVISPYLEAGLFQGLSGLGEGIGKYNTPGAEKSRRDNRTARIEAVLAGDPEFRDWAASNYRLFVNPNLAEGQTTPEFIHVPKDNKTNLDDIKKIPGLKGAMTDWQEIDPRQYNPSTFFKGKLPAFKQGGTVQGQSQPVPIMAHSGERVIQANANQVPGLGNILDQLISSLRKMPSYAEGGKVTATKKPEPSTNQDDIFAQMYQEYMKEKTNKFIAENSQNGINPFLNPNALQATAIDPSKIEENKNFAAGLRMPESRRAQGGLITQPTNVEQAIPTQTTPAQTTPIATTQKTTAPVVEVPKTTQPTVQEPANPFRYISPLGGGAMLDPTTSDLGTLINHELARGIPVTEVGGKTSTQQQQEKIANVIALKTGIEQNIAAKIANDFNIKTAGLKEQLMKAQTEIAKIQASGAIKTDPTAQMKVYLMAAQIKQIEDKSDLELLNAMQLSVKSGAIKPAQYSRALIPIILKRNPMLMGMSIAEVRQALGQQKGWFFGLGDDSAIKDLASISDAELSALMQNAFESYSKQQQIQSGAAQTSNITGVSFSDSDYSVE